MTLSSDEYFEREYLRYSREIEREMPEEERENDKRENDADESEEG